MISRARKKTVLPLPCLCALRQQLGATRRASVGLTVREDVSHLEIAGGKSDDARLVELTGDCAGQWQQLGQLQELGVLLLPATARCVLALLLHLKRTSFSVRYEQPRYISTNTQRLVAVHPES